MSSASTPVSQSGRRREDKRRHRAPGVPRGAPRMRATEPTEEHLTIDDSLSDGDRRPRPRRRSTPGRPTLESTERRRRWVEAVVRQPRRDNRRPRRTLRSRAILLDRAPPPSHLAVGFHPLNLPAADRGRTAFDDPERQRSFPRSPAARIARGRRPPGPPLRQGSDDHRDRPSNRRRHPRFGSPGAAR